MVYDSFESLEQVQRVAHVHPPKVKVIASAKIKTDKIDAQILARLLRVGLTPEVLVPAKEVWILKDITRFLVFVVKVNTMIKNRIHDLLHKAHIIPRDVKDLFGRYGGQWLDEIRLSDERKDELLRFHLTIHDTFMVKEQELRKWCMHELRNNQNLRHIMTIPGVGEVFSALIPVEIDDIHRFPSRLIFTRTVGLCHQRIYRGERSTMTDWFVTISGYGGYLLKVLTPRCGYHPIFGNTIIG